LFDGASGGGPTIARILDRERRLFHEFRPTTDDQLTAISGLSLLHLNFATNGHLQGSGDKGVNSARAA